MPSLRRERELLRSGHALVAGMDEVGRGALAGPVSVGVVVVSAASRSAPVGLRDSKLLAPAARVALVPRLRRWARSWAVGHAGPEEIDAVGILAALRLAGQRALAQLPEAPSVVLLDGDLDWLSRSPSSSAPRPPEPPLEPPPEPSDLSGAGAWQAGGRVVTQVGADLRCAAVAAASVLAKVSRDAIMVELAAAHPPFAWEQNKGYATPRHVRALAEHGPCGQHRRSWRLPGVPPPGPPGGGPSAGAAAGAGTALHGAAGCMMGADER